MKNAIIRKMPDGTFTASIYDETGACVAEHSDFTTEASATKYANRYTAPAEEQTTDTEEEEEDETMKPEVIFSRIREEVEARTERSAWSRGVTAYALDLVDELEEATEGGYFDLSDLEAPKMVDRALLNGADDWNQYSWGGCSLCYDGQIAERLCTPSELKKTRHGERRPNSREEWLDVQARALAQAARRAQAAIKSAILREA
jgi:hypothetical protein